MNAPRCPVHSYHRDGAMRVDGNHGGTIAYEPNTKGEWQEQPAYAEPPLALHGPADRWDYRADDNDYFTQPGDLFRLMTPDKQQLLCENTARNIAGVSQHIVDKHIAHCTQADPAYGAGVARAIEAQRAGRL